MLLAAFATLRGAFTADSVRRIMVCLPFIDFADIHRLNDSGSPIFRFSIQIPAVRQCPMLIVWLPVRLTNLYQKARLALCAGERSPGPNVDRQ